MTSVEKLEQLCIALKQLERKRKESVKGSMAWHALDCEIATTEAQISQLDFWISNGGS